MRLSVSISSRNLYNSLKRIKEKIFIDSVCVGLSEVAKQLKIHWPKDLKEQILFSIDVTVIYAQFSGA